MKLTDLEDNCVLLQFRNAGLLFLKERERKIQSMLASYTMNHAFDDSNSAT